MSEFKNQLKVGKTDDGRVFFSLITLTPDGKPMQATLQWNPEEAMVISKAIEKTVRDIKAESKIIVPAYRDERMG